MNEFIVWDIQEKKFLSKDERKRFAIDFDGNVIPLTNEHNELYSGHGLLEVFKSIGKTDIEGNKIFAESSIVEFHFGTIDSNKIIGVFEYSNFHLCYFIHLINDKRNRAFKFDVTLMKNLKIIGTLQENKE